MQEPVASLVIRLADEQSFRRRIVSPMKCSAARRMALHCGRPFQAAQRPMRRLIRQRLIGVKPLRLLSSLVGYPVRFPRFSPICRKRLLEVW